MSRDDVVFRNRRSLKGEGWRSVGCNGITGGAGDKFLRREKKMDKRTFLRSLSSLLLSVAVVGMLSNCGKKETQASAASSSMVIVFTSGDVKVIKSGKTENASVGMVVAESDQILTTKGTVDLQSRSGNAVRIREFTKVTVAKLTKSDTKLSMKNGGILASIKKNDASENFNVVTPTAIAGVRGTTFSVEVSDGVEPRVHVIEGKVAMAPRVEALDNFSNEEIEAKPELKKLANLQTMHEVILEPNTEGAIPEEVEKTVIEANQVLSKKGVKDEDVSASVASIEKAVEASKGAEAVTIVERPTSISERAEVETLITVDDQLIEKIAEPNGGEAKEAAIDSLAKEIATERAKKQEVVLQKIEKDASEKSLKTSEEIKEFYKNLEKIVMKDGTSITGAVIAQTGELFVIHTEDGVKRVQKDQIDYQQILEDEGTKKQ